VRHADADQMHSSTVLASAMTALFTGWYAQRLARERAEAREGRRRRITAGGVGQVVVLIFGLGTAVGAIFADGVEARNLVIVAVIMLGAFALSVRADRRDRHQHGA
jgi:MFS family permease